MTNCLCNLERGTSSDVNTSDGGLLVDYVFITITVSIPLMVDY